MKLFSSSMSSCEFLGTIDTPTLFLLVGFLDLVVYDISCQEIPVPKVYVTLYVFGANELWAGNNFHMEAWYFRNPNIKIMIHGMTFSFCFAFSACRFLHMMQHNHKIINSCIFSTLEHLHIWWNPVTKVFLLDICLAVTTQGQPTSQGKTGRKRLRFLLWFEAFLCIWFSPFCFGLF